MDGIRGEVRIIVAEFCNEQISAEAFEKELQKICETHSNPANIGRAISSALDRPGMDRVEEVWTIADNVDSNIRDNMDDWLK